MGSNPTKSVLHQAQVQLRKCEFCKADKDIYYTCDQCQVYACRKCAILHQESSPNHVITETGSNSPKTMQLMSESEQHATSVLCQAQVHVRQTSESVHQEQDHSICGLCHTEIIAPNRCVKCQIHMCLKCCIVHIQSSHSIKTIDDMIQLKENSN
ncbi:unnamed protein product [Mytilus edulis]|uniref:B box-type domain-containing protein n=1 Tax=Mytilus edulis TaxID=6550 RepID=A0A8S3RFY5_MYTED|nr:unnamed protein product [Mytilus edulis]